MATIESNDGNTSSIGVVNEAARTVATPSTKDDKKREASSPLYEDLTQKKSKHTPGEENSDGDLFGEPSDTHMGSPMQIQGDDVYVLSQPVNPLDVVQVAKELRLLMLPELKALFSDQLPIIQTMVKTAMKEANTELNKQVKRLDTEVQGLKEENARLSDENNDIRERLSKVEFAKDDLEQYSRRNSVRISGYPEDTSENTDNIVLSIARELDVEIIKSDIDRSHRVGKPTSQRSGRPAQNKQRPRDILVKFATYNARQQLYEMRKDLRNSENETMKQLFINEDLTKKRSQLLYDARCLFRVEKLAAAYSLDGRLFVRDDQNHRHYIQSDDDLKVFGDPTEAKKELALLARLPPHLRKLRSGGLLGARNRPLNMRRPMTEADAEAARGYQSDS